MLEQARSGVITTEMAKLFGMARRTVYIWLSQPADHIRKKSRQTLAQLVAGQPDMMVKKMAHF